MAAAYFIAVQGRIRHLTDADGSGIVTGQRLYQLVRSGQVQDHTFEITFLDPGVQAFAFTFG